jgi:hypothetical protein
MNPITMTLALLACLILGARPPQGTRLAEPPQEFVLQGNGKELELRIGQPVELPKDLAGQKVTLRVRPTRLFDYQGLRFRYPQSYTWEFEPLESGEQFVTLSGHTNVLILQIHPGKPEPGALLEKLAQSIADRLGSRTKMRAAELVGKEQRKLAGKHLEATLAGAKITQDVFTFRVGDETAALIVQDSLTDEGKTDPETEAALQLLAETLEWPK